MRGVPSPCTAAGVVGTLIGFLELIYSPPRVENNKQIGNDARTLVPDPNCVSTQNFPPSDSTRSRKPANPSLSPAPLFEGENPGPLSATSMENSSPLLSA